MNINDEDYNYEYFRGWHDGYAKGFEDGCRAAMPQERPGVPAEPPEPPKWVIEALTQDLGDPKEHDATRRYHRHPARSNGHGGGKIDPATMYKRVLGIEE